MSPLQEVRLFDAESGKPRKPADPEDRMDLGNSFIWDLDFSADGTLLAAADFQGYATVWETEKGNVRLRLRAAAGRMTHLGFTSDNHLLTFSRVSQELKSSRRLQLWEMSDGTEIDMRFGIPAAANSLVLNPNTGSVLCTGTTGTLWQFPIDSPDFVVESTIPGMIGFLRDDFLICPEGSEVRRVALYDLTATGGPKAFWTLSDARASSRIAVDARRSSAIIHVDEKFHRIEFTEGIDAPHVINPPAFHSSLSSISFMGRSDRILGVVGGRNSSPNTISLMDPAMAAPIKTFVGPMGTECTALVSANDDQTVIGLFQDQPDKNAPKTMLVCFDAVTQKIVMQQSFLYRVFALTVSKDSRRFAIAGEDKSIAIYDAVTLEPVLRFRAHDGAITQLVFHPSESLIASGADDLSVRIWHADSGSQLKTFLGPNRPVRSLAFNASGSLLACNSNDKVTRVWKIDTQALLHEIPSRESKVDP
ncbi:MAG: WD40 repeat domain-containing protein [Planctomycetota bacterium]|nr:WD40 repeat domain-containing protein [Planctomycetota bacterium]